MSQNTSPTPMHTKAWSIRLDLFEEGDATRAHAVLDTGANVLQGKGTAHRNPADASVPEIGDEFAAGRALVDLGYQLLRYGSDDAASDEGVVIHSR